MSPDPETHPESADEERSPESRTEPAVHACIVHHRGLEMLGECLRTLLASRGVDLRVVILSNHCQEPLPELVDTDDRVHVVRSDRSIGFSEANNTAAAWAEEHLGPADYFYFLNNDTESKPETLERLIAGLELTPGAAVAGPTTLIQAAPDYLNSLGINITEDAWAWDEGIGIHLDEYGPLPGLREVAAVTGSALLISAEARLRVGGWTEAYDWYFEDIDLCLKVWKQGSKVVHVPEAVIYHRVSATMTTGAERKFFYFWRNRLLLAVAHWPGDLLLRVLRWAVVSEILKPPWAHTKLQRRALLGAIPKLPRMLALRYRFRGPDTWRRFLNPRGAVPDITLPRTTTAEEPATPSGAEGSGQDDAGDGDEPAMLEASLWRPVAEQWREGVGREGAEAGQRRVLVLGWGPLPFESARMNYAPGTRSWQMALPLAEAGHRVLLVYAPIPGASFDDGEPTYRRHRGVHVLSLPRRLFEAEGSLESLVDGLRPEVLVGAAPVPSLWAVRLAGKRPVWVDLFGDPMAEAQARARHLEAGDHLGAYWRLMAELLSRGDAFGAVSARQRLAVVGQLSLAGRLDGASAGEEQVHVLPCALPPRASRGGTGEAADGDGSSPAPAAGGELRLLWSGGFNTWCDADTLMAGLEGAMDADPGLVLDATGGAIGGHDVDTYARVEEAFARSRHRERLRLHGALPTAEAEAML
ncbi:MAG: glycosyltransferase, partial [Holophagales bacterium]|nr:glycosyltransferase [Holophagales bacterium]